MKRLHLQSTCVLHLPPSGGVDTETVCVHTRLQVWRGQWMLTDGKHLCRDRPTVCLQTGHISFVAVEYFSCSRTHHFQRLLLVGVRLERRFKGCAVSQEYPAQCWIIPMLRSLSHVIATTNHNPQIGWWVCLTLGIPPAPLVPACIKFRTSQKRKENVCY